MMANACRFPRFIPCSNQEEVLPALARDLEQAAADRLAAAHPRSSASPAPPAFNTHGNKPKAPSHPPQAGKGTAVSVKTHVPPSNSTKPTSAQQACGEAKALFLGLTSMFIKISKRAC